MKHGITFTREMVLAGIAGRKTQTRRVIVPQPEFPNHLGCENDMHHFSSLTQHEALALHWCGEHQIIPCPYGGPGHVLAVREAYQIIMRGHLYYVKYLADGARRKCNNLLVDEDYIRWKKRKNPLAVTPGRFMPLSLARYQILVSDVRVKRIQEISEADAKSEGIDIYSVESQICRYKFRELWDSIDAKRGYGWESNPWVWVITHEWREI